MHKGIIIIASIILAFCLTVCGAYITIDNLIEPQGLLFEGIISMSLGIILLMIVVIATTIGKTVMVFGEILEETMELNKQIVKARPPQMPNLFQGLMPGSSMTITDLDTGEIKSTPINPNANDNIKSINDMIMKVMNAGKTPGKDTPPNLSLNELTDKELHKALGQAIKGDDYEQAAKINAILKERKDSGSDTSENKNEQK